MLEVLRDRVITSLRQVIQNPPASRDNVVSINTKERTFICPLLTVFIVGLSRFVVTSRKFTTRVGDA